MSFKAATIERRLLSGRQLEGGGWDHRPGPRRPPPPPSRRRAQKRVALSLAPAQPALAARGGL